MMKSLSFKFQQDGIKTISMELINQPWKRLNQAACGFVFVETSQLRVFQFKLR